MCAIHETACLEKRVIAEQGICVSSSGHVEFADCGKEVHFIGGSNYIKTKQPFQQLACYPM